MTWHRQAERDYVIDIDDDNMILLSSWHERHVIDIPILNNLVSRLDTVLTSAFEWTVPGPFHLGSPKQISTNMGFRTGIDINANAPYETSEIGIGIDSVGMWHGDAF